MVSLTAGVERIDREMEKEDHTVAECKEYIDSLHTEKMTLRKTFAQWERVGGAGVDTGVKKTVTALEQAADDLIKNIRVTIDRVRPEKGLEPAPAVGQGARPKTAKSKTVTQIENSHLNNSSSVSPTMVLIQKIQPPTQIRPPTQILPRTLPPTLNT